MSTVVTINGTAVSCPRPILPLRLIPFRRGGVPTFSFEVRGGVLVPEASDPCLGRSVTVTINGTLYFSGRVISRQMPFQRGTGWVHRYQSVGLRHLGDLVPHTDGNNGADSSSYNLSQDNYSSEYLASRAGRTVGQVLTDVLTNVPNATALSGYGIGNYTGLPTSPALPAATVSDLAALTVIPQSPVYLGGEKLLTAVDSFLSLWAPNHLFHVQPNGTLRVLDMRSFTAHTFTINTDPIAPTELSCDLAECFGRVLVRGEQIAEMFEFSTARNTLTEDFAWGTYTSAAAKAAWTPNDFYFPQNADEGTCTCLSTTTVRVTSSNASRAWAANAWDQTGGGFHGNLLLTDSAGTSITTLAQRRAVANTALVAAGTSDFTLDRALPVTSYDHYTLRGLTGGPSVVWTLYALPTWAGPKVAPQSTYPFAYRFGGGSGVTLTSSPMGAVGFALGQEASVAVAVDPSNGTVRFATPTYLTAGGVAPVNVRVVVPIYTGVNQAIEPPDVSGVPQYSGRGKTSFGRTDTLTVTVRAWRDPLNLTPMLAYASDLLDSVKDPVVEGDLVYYGLYEPALTPGLAVNVAGSAYTTGWEAAALPVLECQLEWNTEAGTSMSHTTTMHCSSRRAHFTDSAFLHPDRTGISFDFGGGIDLSGLGGSLPTYGGVAGYNGVADYGPAGGRADVTQLNESGFNQSYSQDGSGGAAGYGPGGNGLSDVRRGDETGFGQAYGLQGGDHS
jgi:hypothetical protein